MKKIWLIALCVGVLLVVILYSNISVSENIVEKDLINSDETNYDVSITDDTIYFIDEFGNGIFYNFDGDNISSISSFIKVDSLEQAEAVKTFYLESLDSGDVREIVTNSDGIFIYYNDSYISNFEGYTKEELQNKLMGEM